MCVRSELLPSGSAGFQSCLTVNDPGVTCRDMCPKDNGEIRDIVRHDATDVTKQTLKNGTLRDILRHPRSMSQKHTRNSGHYATRCDRCLSGNDQGATCRDMCPKVNGEIRDIVRHDATDVTKQPPKNETLRDILRHPHSMSQIFVTYETLRDKKPKLTDGAQPFYRIQGTLIHPVTDGERND